MSFLIQKKRANKIKNLNGFIIILSSSYVNTQKQQIYIFYIDKKKN